MKLFSPPSDRERQRETPTSSSSSNSSPPNCPLPLLLPRLLVVVSPPPPPPPPTSLPPPQFRHTHNTTQHLPPTKQEERERERKRGNFFFSVPFFPGEESTFSLPSSFWYTVHGRGRKIVGCLSLPRKVGSVGGKGGVGRGVDPNFPSFPLAFPGECCVCSGSISELPTHSRFPHDLIHCAFNCLFLPSSPLA